MRCRTMQDGTIVWFGSIGKNDDGTAIFVDEAHSNFSDKQEGVATSLSQRLSVIEGELWYNLNYGVPLTEKIKSKTEMDMFVAKTVNEHPDVISISSFESEIVGTTYKCKMLITSKFGSLELNI